MRENTQYLNMPPSQLEAIIRISESLAKLTLSSTVKNHHVEEAIRLFKFSTMDAVAAGSADGLSRGELNEEMTRIERDIRRRLPLGWTTTYSTLSKEFVTQQGYSSHALERTLYILEKREVIRFSGQKKVIHRCVFHAALPSIVTKLSLVLVFSPVRIFSLASIETFVCTSNVYQYEDPQSFHRCSCLIPKEFTMQLLQNWPEFSSIATVSS